MTDVMEIRRTAGRKEKGALGAAFSRPWIATLAYCALVIVTLLIFNRNATDYVGADNDDAMRLVEVRDLLAGQGWFDLTQYRLGLAGGTLMHWSRFIDLPIANLISVFRLFLAPERAEALALTVWPLLLVVPFMGFMGLAGRRMGGVVGQHVALGLTALAIVTSGRFVPGSIDHDNVQLGLVALMAAMLVDGAHRPASFAIAGFAAALAVGIGAETTPFVAVVCMIVAALWAWEGADFAPAAKAFALTLTLAITAAFFLTVPPHLYSTVTCDNLSLGFYGITSVGGAGLLASVMLASHRPRAWRLAALAATGSAVLATALVLAPQCLRSPLADLDPMLVDLWLNGVSEAQSILSIARTEPETVGAFYATGLLGIVVCIFRIARRDRAQLHAILLAMLLVNWVIALVQVRGALFSNVLAILPLTLFILDLRRMSNADPEDPPAALFYVVGVLVSVPAVWAVGGSLAAGNGANLFSPAGVFAGEEGAACFSQAAIAPLVGLAPGVVAASSNMGAPILRFTPHRVLSAPYHRDQGGMLTEMHIGLSQPAEAEAFLRGAGVTLLAYCAKDPQTESIARLKPDGLYAALAKGNVPAYLKPLASGDGVQIFRVTP